MRKRVTRLAAGGALGLAVLTGGALVVPAVASAAVSSETDTATELADRVTAIREALAGLVSDGTVTQEQADRVAETLAGNLPGRGFGHGHGHGGPGGRGGVSLEAAAETLGMTEEELREALSDGDTLAEVAGQEDVEVQTLVDALVAAAEERLAQAVEDGRLTEEEAAAESAELQERISTLVEQGGPLGRGHRDFRGGPPAGSDRAGHDSAADGSAADDPAGEAQPDAEVQGSSTGTRSGGRVVVAV